MPIYITRGRYSADAIKKLEASTYNGPDGSNSSWSKSWLLQGTGKPW